MPTSKKIANLVGSSVRQSWPRPVAGFTLMELLVVVVIIGILGSIAIGSYRSSVQKSNRGVAKSALLDLAAREEKYFSLNNKYSSTVTDLYGANSTLTWPISIPLNSTSPKYTLIQPTVGAASTTSTTTTPATFSLEADPTGSQSTDACANFTLNSVGQQGVSGSASNCW